LAFNEITRFYHRSEFAALPIGAAINTILFATHLDPSSLDVPILGLAPALGGDAVRIDWQEFPTLGDLAVIASKVASFPGGATGHDRLAIESLGTDLNTGATYVPKLTGATAQLDAGVYLVTWTAALAAEGAYISAKLRITRSDGWFAELLDSWSLLDAPHAFTGALPVPVEAGQTLSVLLSFALLGGFGTARMSGARVAIDRVVAE
jgi:hypothetical protein